MRLKFFIALFILFLSMLPAAASDVDHVLIFEFLPNPAAASDEGEYVKIINPSDEMIDISCFILTDLEGEITIPSDTHLGPGSDYIFELPAEGVALKNSGDEVILLDNRRNLVDCVIYGDSDYNTAGWHGKGVGDAFDERVFRRFYPDMDTDTAYEWLPLREYYRGQSNFLPPLRDVTADVTCFVSPDCSLDPLLARIRAASTIRANIYLFESSAIEDAIIELLDRGGVARILVERDPVGGMSHSELLILKNIIDHGGEVRFTNDPLYNLNHAKYALFDDDTILITSENWNNDGFPPPETGGNRGWGIVIENGEIFDDLYEVFEYDWQHGLDLYIQNIYEVPEAASDHGLSWYGNGFDPLSLSGNFSVQLIIAPDNSLHYETIIGLINSANKSIYIEEAYIRRDWGDHTNPYLDATIDAARRGVEVKILLDSMWYNLDGNADNDDLCRYVNEISKNEDLNLEARLVRRDGITKIHNKGVIVDSEKVLISSINWNKHSPTYNREVGVIIQNPEIGAYYSEVFMKDWEKSGNSWEMVVIAVIMFILLVAAIYFIKRTQNL